MLHRGTKPGALYKGAYKPGKLYKGTQLVAGYADVSKAAPASWDGTYDDVMGVAATGKGKQQTYSGVQLLNTPAIRQSAAQNGINWTVNADGSVTASGVSTETSFWGEAVSFDKSKLLYLPAGQYCFTGSAGQVGVYFFGYYDDGIRTPEIYVSIGSYNTYVFSQPVWITVQAYVSGAGKTVEETIYPMIVAGSTPTAYEPYVGGKPSPSPDYPQPLVAAEGTLTASGRTGTAPTTVTLPVLRAIPGTDIRDTLAYIGGGQWQVTRRVGVVQLTGTETWTVGGQYREDKMDWYYVSARLADAVDSSDAACACTHYRHGIIANNTTTQGAGIVWQAIRVRYGDPPDGTNTWKAFLAAQAAAGDPVTIWYALATPTTETLTLGELPSYPVHTALAVSSDYPPDVIGTCKVGT